MDRLSRSEREEADALIARAQSGDGPAERAAAASLLRWAQGQPHRESYVRRLDAASRMLERAAPELQERYPRPARVNAARLRRFPGVAVHAAAVCSIVVALAAIVWWNNPVIDNRFIESAIGEQRAVALADGSRITLNSRSRVEVRLRLRSREAILEEGEALFEVGKSPYRPWTTFAAAARVSVLGTVFNVRHDGGAVRLTVFEGRVAFDPGSGLDVVQVEAGRAAEARNGSLVHGPVVANLAVAGAWREKRMVFDDTALAEAMREAGRYRRAQIRLDPAISGLRITGAFPTTDPERLLNLLSEALPVLVIRNPDGSVDIRPRQPEPAGAWQAPELAGRPRS